jgi:hypothetical protein
LWHRILTHDLPLYFPEADRFHRSSRGDWFRAFLEAFPSPHMITAMDKDAFIAAAWPVIGRRVFISSTVARLRHFATVLGLMPSSRLSCASPQSRPRTDGGRAFDLRSFGPALEPMAGRPSLVLL